ncbi:hypothetical protein JYU34_005224 [Plutella xylostella]|uniref:Sema domain-containing protein n=1 Tax=Plutella xylostella TaxID=51655 RepID=A0ABQ7QWA5_PLUXY|nr:hypothetical protein JYU34_005224 [Plutella xylostella]
MWPNVCQVAALILLSTLSKAEMPEDDFRIINKQDLLAFDSDIFEDKSTKSFSQLLFDVARDQVVVGARDALLRLSLRGLRPLERAEWGAPQDAVKLCLVKGQSERDCRNYIRVLLAHGARLLACGTNAFSPVCSWREIESIGQVLDWSSGVASCPHSPHSNVTSILTSTGEFFAGTTTDFTSSYTTIGRSRGASTRDLGPLRTPPYDPNWLNEPQFVGSFEDDHFVYFVFREVAVEYMNCGKTVYSRIARVCKNDAGGHLTMKENWSTFLKARLACSVPGDVPFYYDEVTSVQYVPRGRVLVAAFTTQSNGIAGSAICVYNMSDVKAAFSGAFKVQDSPRSSWEPRAPTPRAVNHFSCLPDAQPHETIEYMRYHLMHQAVQPITGKPLYTATLERFTHITSDITVAKPVGNQYVIFVATQKNQVLKLAVLPKFEGACLVETWNLDDGKGLKVLTMEFVKDTMSLYIGSDTSLLRLGVPRCARYNTRSICLGVGDPYCGWDDARELCVDAPTHIYEPYFRQNTGECGKVDAPVDGGWSSWSAPEPCVQDTARDMYSDQPPDMCVCRRRACDNPRPHRGGAPCQGASISVSNCTVHGGWSPWSAWSECSATCGIAIKSRRRACSSPEPRHGGRVCVGLDSQQLYCTTLPPCPDPELAPVDGGWSEWGPWSNCTSDTLTCGPKAGIKERHRTCTNPAPKSGGVECEGGAAERSACDLRACELKKAAAWTPWVAALGNSTDGSYTEKRFKFLCRAATPEQIKLTIAKEEDRYCTAPGVCSSRPPASDKQPRAPCRRPPCTRPGTEDGWGPWSAWSECSGGERERRRTCSHGECRGDAVQTESCEDDIDNELSPMLNYTVAASFVKDNGSLGAGSIVGCVLAAFAMGCLVCLAAVIYCSRRHGTRLPWHRSTRVPSSPHYITAKQNSYVTVPLKDVPRKAKRQPSFTGIGGASGILLSKSNNISNANNHNNSMATPKLYPKAIANEYDSMGTLRRHSNLPNHRNNLDMEEEKFY